MVSYQTVQHKSLDPDTEAIKNFDSMHKLKLNVVIGARGKSSVVKDCAKNNHYNHISF